LTVSDAQRQENPIVALNGVHMTLASSAGPVRILRGIDLEIGSGETVSVVGPSGAGKSTMMMIMAGLERPSLGSVRVADHELTEMNEDALALFRRDHVGIVFQSFHLVPTMTALENVAIPLEFARRDDAFERAREELETVGLGHRLSHYPSQLSGGEQQRVALARALVPEPALLLADEPTGNLDGATGGQIIELMFELSTQRKATLVLITHDIRLAERCRRNIQVADGLVVDGAPPAAAPAMSRSTPDLGPATT
jgi:putative ABC transport system ATP-binding protein